MGKRSNDYRIEGDTAYLTLVDRRGQPKAEVAIDRADLPIVLNAGLWSYTKPRRNLTAYARCYALGIMLHRWLLTPPDDKEVDHEDGDGLNCRRSNLRIVTHAQNQQNKRGAYRNSQSGVRGVYWDSARNLWRVQVRVDGKAHRLGRYADRATAERVAIEGRDALMTHATN